MIFVVEDTVQTKPTKDLGENRFVIIIIIIIIILLFQSRSFRAKKI